MNEFDQDALLTGAFSEFSSAAAPTVRPLGAQAVRGEVAHRRKVRAVALSVVAALVIALPVAGYAAFGRESQAPPTPGTSVVPTPSVSESASPTASASPVPDGRITISQLTAGDINVPSWDRNGGRSRCDDGMVTIKAKANTQAQTYVKEIAYANLDGDPALETAALLICPEDEEGPSAVLVYDRDDNGRIVFRGKILESSKQIARLWHVSATKDKAGVAIEVSDIVACCADSPENEFHQTRTYAWNGTAYIQTAGPTDFSGKPLVTDLELKVGTTKLTKDATGKRTLTVDLTVRNIGQVSSGLLAVQVLLDGQGTVVARDWIGNASECSQPQLLKCHDPLKPGKSFTMTVTITFPAGQLTPPNYVDLDLMAGGFHTGGEIHDPNFENNRARIAVPALWNAS